MLLNNVVHAFRGGLCTRKVTNIRILRGPFTELETMVSKHNFVCGWWGASRLILEHWCSQNRSSWGINWLRDESVFFHICKVVRLMRKLSYFMEPKIS
jgi:hypothetical protein